MTQENGPQLENLIRRVEQAAQSGQEQGVTNQMRGWRIRKRTRDLFAACPGELPHTLVVYKDGSPDFQLDTRAGNLVNVFAQRPRPLSNAAWAMLGTEVIRAVRGATLSQSV